MAFALEGPTLIEVEQGKSATAIIRVLATSRPYRNVSLRITGLPSGVSAEFSPWSGKPSFQSTLTLLSSSTSETGTFTLTITARDAKGTKTMPVVFKNYTVNIPPAPPPAPFTADFYVDKDGLGGSPSDSNPGTITQPFLTIQKGITSLTAGKKLAIRAATYTENIDVQSYTIPAGTSWVNPITIQAYPSETVVLRGWIQLQDNVDLSILQYLIFDGINVDGQSTRSYCLRLAGNTHHVIFKNADLHHTLGNVVISAAEVNNIQFLNNLVHDALISDFPGEPGTTTSNYGLYVKWANSLIEDCTIYNNTGNGIHHFDPLGSNASDNTYRRNLFYGNYYSNDGTRGQQGGQVIITSGSNNLFYNNILRDTSGPLVVYHLQLDSGTNNQAYNNTIYGNTGVDGIRYRGTNTKIQNNIAYLTAGINDLGATNPTVDHNLTTDPSFVNESTRDFHLQSSSAARNQGTTIAAVTDDWDGLTRPQGSAYDIGAFEFDE